MKNSKKLILISLSSGFFISSCGLVELNKGDSYQSISRNKSDKMAYTVDLARYNSKKTGISFSVAIKSINENFRTKATVSEIKSYEVSLCSNIDFPVTSRLAGSLFKFDLTIAAAGSVVTFTNVPKGGPYFAVVSAFDNLLANGLGNNLTKAKIYTGDGSRQVSVSTNSVTVNQDLTLSPAGVTLQVPVILTDAGSADAGTSITPVDGSNGLFGTN